MSTQASMMPDVSQSSPPRVSVVVIGRNEGERLVRCLESIAAMQTDDFAVETIYVDSASSDGSPERAAAHGARVLEVHADHPSAALGRNAGWRAATGEYVLFLDGDTQVHPLFVHRALAAMREPAVAVVWGHRREANPQQSIYVRVLDLDWIYAPGASDFCGGDALMRRRVLEEVGGFDASLIAGEEPELCRRIRAANGVILHIDVPMTLHDLAITRFGSYWKRAFRAGHAYAEIAARFNDSEDPLWQQDARRNLLHGALLLAAAGGLLLSIAWPWLAGILLAGGLAMVVRTFRRSAWKSDKPGTRLLYAMHSHFQQIPIMLGQLGYHFRTNHGRPSRLIEYKRDDTGQITRLDRVLTFSPSRAIPMSALRSSREPPT